MTLYDFVERFVCHNSQIRLWVPTRGGHKMLESPDNITVGMEWQLLKGEGWMTRFKDCRVIGLKDIYVDDFYREAINIVIDINK